MKKLLVLLVLAFSTQSFADAWYTQADGNLGASRKVKCGMNVTCTKSTGQVTITPSPIVSVATATTLTAAQCGSIITNSATGVMTLPEASTVLGCTYTFVTGNASNFDVNPADATDQILILTNAAGDAVRNATVGNTLKIMAISADAWVELSAVGTWTDVN